MDEDSVVPDMEVCAGSIVWGKHGKLWYPAMIIEGEMVGKPKSSELKSWVMWFGELRISEVLKKDLMDFGRHFKEMFVGVDMSLRREYAVVDALRVCMARAKIKVYGYRETKKWGEKRFPKLVAKRHDLFEPRSESDFPVSFIDKMKELKCASQSDTSDQDSDEDSDVDDVEDEIKKLHITKNTGLCNICNETTEEKLYEHPLFECRICLECRNDLSPRLLHLDKFGYYTFCAICGGKEGTDYVCSQVNCGRKYCHRCIKQYLDPESRREIKHWLPWNCFLCDERICNNLKVRSNWQQNIVSFLNPDCLQSECRNRCTGERIRVLSVYDGTSSVKQALIELNLNIDLYVAVEPNAAAREVIMKNKGNVNLQVVDSIKTLMINEEIEKMCPIDLVIANLPDEYLDIEQEEEAKGMSVAVISYISSLIKQVRKFSPQRHVYWMIQSTTHMTSDWRAFLSSLLETQPFYWDAQFVSPYMNPHLYWGNIPGLDRYKHISKRRDVLTLDECLDDDRQAKMKRIRNCAFDSSSTCTANGQYKTCVKVNNYKLPVIEDKKEKCIRVEECEKVLGLPDDYTFIQTNSLTERQTLLKKAPSVLLLKEILMPISKCFASANRKRKRQD